MPNPILRVVRHPRVQRNAPRLWRILVTLALLGLMAVIAGPTGALAAPAAPGTYTVKPGDTVAKIAERLGVSSPALVKANNLRNVDLLYVGQKLKLPAAMSSAVAPKAAAPKAAAPAAQPAAPEPTPVPVPPASAQGVAPADTEDSGALDLQAQAESRSLSPAEAQASVAAQAQAAEAELSALTLSGAEAAAAAAKGRWIDINLTKQRLVAYNGATAVMTTLISSGTKAHPTQPGNFKVRVKVPSQTMSGPGYRLPGVPYVMYFMGANAIHGTYWHKNFGKRMSHGCINLPTPKAAWLYNWSKVGTPVKVHY